MTNEVPKNEESSEPQGQEMTQEQMEAEAKVREEMNADRVAVVTRGIAQGLLAVIYQDKEGQQNPKPKQSDPAVQLIEPLLDGLYFLLKDLKRAADAQERMASALELQCAMMEKAFNPPQVATPEYPTEAPDSIT